jgi:flavin-dependent dehydrogenase
MPDVIIVGGGPAGSCAAIRCAQWGLRVLLLEREAFPRNRPGESLHPGFEGVLRQVGVLEMVLDAGFLRFDGNHVIRNGTATFEPFPIADNRVRGLQASRPEFDAILLERARQMAVEIIQPGRGLLPLISGGRVTGVESADGKLESTFVIDAAGRGQWLARHMGLQTHVHSPRWIAHYAYLEGECPARDDNPAFLFDDTGWTWTVRVRPGLYNWTRLNVYDNAIAESFMPAELRNLRQVGLLGSADVTWRMTPACAGAGYFLCGDAAGVLDPTSSHGVVKAMVSGIVAADAIAQIADHHQTEEEAVQDFRRTFQEWFNHDATRLKADYRRMFGDRIARTLGSQG